MFKSMSKFQIILIGLFVVFIVGGMVAFSLFKGRNSNNVPTITIWGTVDGGTFSSFADRVVFKNKNHVQIRYREIPVASFDSTLLEALATGRGPDAILVGQDSLLKEEDKIVAIPYKTLPEVDFKSTFIQEGELFLNSNGILAIPFSVDPMVMYWNRDIFTNANVSLPPKYWDQFLTLAPTLTQRDQASNITQSAVALGEYLNIDHAKDILNMLMIQTGNPLVVMSTGGYQTTIASTFNNGLSAANSSLTFYTQFADPRKDFYTWNRSLHNSKNLFLENSLGVYFGFASELREIQAKNPNLNFDVAVVPQPRPLDGKSPVSITFGRLYGFAILRSAGTRAADAYKAINYLTSANSLALWTQITGLPAVRRDALIANPSDAASSVFTTSALWSRGWLDPDAQGTEAIYKAMIEGVTSGRLLYSEAISGARDQMQNLLDTINKLNK
jgi:ABC-type glycerol-3-phosphate transport system substrate-binding protein